MGGRSLLEGVSRQVGGGSASRVLNRRRLVWQRAARVGPCGRGLSAVVGVQFSIVRREYVSPSVVCTATYTGKQLTVWCKLFWVLSFFFYKQQQQY
jgi:hypothetical protein